VSLCNTRLPPPPPPPPPTVHSLLPASVPLFSSQSGRTYVRSPTSSAIFLPSTARRQPLGDRDGARAARTPAGDQNCADRKGGQDVIRRITAQSTAHPLRSATPLTGAVKAYKIGSRPKWISATDILPRCSVMLRPRRATSTRRVVLGARTSSTSKEMKQTLIRCAPPFRRMPRFMGIFTVQDATDTAVPVEECAMSKSSRTAAFPCRRKQWVRYLGLTCPLVSRRTQEKHSLLLKHGSGLCQSGSERDSVHTPAGAPRSVGWQHVLFGQCQCHFYCIPFVNLLACGERR